MKKITFLFAVILTFSTIAFISCDKDDDEPNSSLYGSWARDHSQVLRIRYTFNSDLTGKLEDMDPSSNNVIESYDFNYSFNDNEITLDWGYVMRYRISGNVLSLEEEPDSENFKDFTKVGSN